MKKLIILLLLLIPFVNKAQEISYRELLDNSRISNNNDTLILNKKYFINNKAIKDIYTIKGEYFTIIDLSILTRTILILLGESIIKLTNELEKKQLTDKTKIDFIIKSITLDDADLLLKILEISYNLNVKYIKYE